MPIKRVSKSIIILDTNKIEALTREILVLGDSHTPTFNHPLFKEKFPKLFFNVLTVIGATASGLENPNSKTKAYPIFRKAIKQSTAKQVIVMLGEVDTGFVIWYRAQKYQESVPAMMNKAIASYSRYLVELSEERCIWGVWAHVSQTTGIRHPQTTLSDSRRF